jgi:hypothetical protein
MGVRASVSGGCVGIAAGMNAQAGECGGGGRESEGGWQGHLPRPYLRATIAGRRADTERPKRRLRGGVRAQRARRGLGCHFE